MKLFTRYDLRDASSKQDALNLFAILSKSLSYEKIKVMYLDCLRGSRREQVKFYDVDKAILHFEAKIKSGDIRFLKGWEKHLKTLQKVKKL